MENAKSKLPVPVIPKAENGRTPSFYKLWLSAWRRNWIYLARIAQLEKEVRQLRDLRSAAQKAREAMLGATDAERALRNALIQAADVDLQSQKYAIQFGEKKDPNG